MDLAAQWVFALVTASVLSMITLKLFVYLYDRYITAPDYERYIMRSPPLPQKDVEQYITSIDDLYD